MRGKIPREMLNRSKMIKLSSIAAVDESNLRHSFFPSILKDGTHSFGQCTSYLKFLGNPVTVLKPYRAAFYSLLGVPSQAETVPTWNPKKHALLYQTSQVFADPIMKRALTTFVPSSQEHLLLTFYGSKPELLKFRPPLAFTPLSWDNHLWSLAAEALSLYFLVKEQTADPRSFTDLLASISED